MSSLPYENVQVSVRLTADGQHVAFGVLVEDGFFPFYSMPAGGFADDLATIAQDKGQYQTGGGTGD